MPTSREDYDRRIIVRSREAVERSKKLLAKSEHLVPDQMVRPNHTFFAIQQALEEMEKDAGAAK